VTSARFAEWSGRRREGDRDDGQPVERSEPRVGHGGKHCGVLLQIDFAKGHKIYHQTSSWIISTSSLRTIIQLPLFWRCNACSASASNAG
jgi:hypothetical protein